MKKDAPSTHETLQAGPPKRAWQRMLSGRRLDLLDPDPADIEIEDIAHGLARVARWNGQTLGLARLLGRPALPRRGGDRGRARSRVARPLAACRAAARCARVRGRRPHQPLQERDRPRLQAARAASARCHPRPLRAADRAARRGAGRDQGLRPNRRLLRGNQARRLRGGRGDHLFRQPEWAVRGKHPHARTGSSPYRPMRPNAPFWRVLPGSPSDSERRSALQSPL